MTAGEVLTVVRRTLNDQIAGRYRWGDPELLRYLSDAQRALYAARTDAFLSGSTVDKPVELTATTDTMKVDEEFRLPLMQLTCAYALEEDSEDRGRPELAVRYREDFDRFVKGH